MELSRTEVYKNQKISIGVTLLSFVVMLLFFIFTNIITTNSSSVNMELSEVTLSMDNGNPDNDPIPAKAIAPFSAEKKETPPEKIQTAESDIVLKNTDQVAEVPGDIKNPIVSEIPGDFKGDPSLGFDLAERSIVTKPNFIAATREEGKVVVEVVVDKNGTVTEANPNGRGTTTSSNSLKTEAKKMALATKFSQHQKFEEQRGTITIIFSFN